MQKRNNDFLDIEPEPIELQEFPAPNLDENKTSQVDIKEEWLLLRNKHPAKRFFIKLWKGPREPVDLPPSFPSKWSWTAFVDSFPEQVFMKRFPNKLIRIVLLIIYCSAWYSVVFLLLHPYLIRAPYYHPADGSEKVPIFSLSCNSYLNWEGKNNACGLEAKDCGPFENAEYIIRCPALCDRGAWIYSAITVGNNRIKYTGYEIGGGRLDSSTENDDMLTYPYRADSFPCGAAVHAGIVSPLYGGCARLTSEGFQSEFPSIEGKHGTDLSIFFGSFFPGSYSFRSIKSGILNGCYDPRAAVVTINILFGLPVFYLFESIYGYWISTITGYWTLVLALDPPLLTDPHDMATVYELFSVGFQRLLPLCFVLYVLWKCAVKRTLENGSPLAKILLWYPMLWLGIMNNITFDRLPVDRLTARDLKEQAGALLAVSCIAGTILTCAIIQAYSLWKSGRFRKYLKIYLLLIFGLVTLASIPGLNLRIHHYILGTILVPGCATRGSSAYLFQGILIGLVLSGVSRWDFASIVETDVALLRGEAGALSEPPVFVFDKMHLHALSWQLQPNVTDNDSLDGFSLLMNDFEVYVGTNYTVDIDTLLTESPTLDNMLKQALQESETDSVELYFRVARASTRAPREERGDYTNAGTLKWPQCEWHDPLPGVS
ncbi:hypothetical protein KAFR_0B01340 [Kazachstania africana CBS 2517]|uniref:LCCL domain-containing protein n=1 Tax=Kazachstania africana (strain ATCC 22294 / BCRC 22015 / CBS 2517 / CECT 1963 / NBRC 1671 / NRRL Y-8276) TaxID=1071382 RepID=H2APY3_KAZAF|nr:hypothetical protein KAFR_0B01340 [Kazachstania africana CBS 2517]CCF56433.1 hypothetical protein KAFR_0B01340 [Kazachstania africana CBS 2517]